MTRIAIVTPTFPPYRSGIGHVALAHAEALARDHDVVVYTPTFWPPDEPPKKFKVRQLKAVLRYGNAAWCRGVRRAVKDAKVVILHYPFFGGIEEFARRGASKSQRLVVYYHMDATGRGIWRIIFWLHRLVYLKRLLKRADIVLTSSYEYAHTSPFLRKLLPKLRGKLFEMPLTVDIKKFLPTDKPTALLNSYDLKVDTPVALFVGGLDRAHYFKGIDVLLKAWHLLQSRMPEARLLIIGEGNRRLSYERQAQLLGLSRSVHFLGAVSDGKLPDYYELSDILVLPSIDRSEAFGLVLLEAMASGCPVLASRLPGISSVVRNGETGYLFPAGDIRALAAALERLLRLPSITKAMGAHARDVIEKEYNSEKISEHFRVIGV